MMRCIEFEASNLYFTGFILFLPDQTKIEIQLVINKLRDDILRNLLECVKRHIFWEISYQLMELNSTIKHLFTFFYLFLFFFVLFDHVFWTELGEM